MNNNQIDIIKGCASIQTLKGGTAEEEKEKAFRCLETKNFELKKEIEWLKKQTKRLNRASVEFERWTFKALMTIAAVNIAIVIVLFFTLNK